METSDYNKIALKLSPMLSALSHPARVQIMLTSQNSMDVRRGVFQENCHLQNLQFQNI